MMDYVTGFFSALWTTFRELFRRPVTIQYPEEKKHLPERARWRIVLTRDPEGEERCVACYLCSAVCPVWNEIRSSGTALLMWLMPHPVMGALATVPPVPVLIVRK